jgi:hypothetical protein
MHKQEELQSVTGCGRNNVLETVGGALWMIASEKVIFDWYLDD